MIGRHDGIAAAVGVGYATGTGGGGETAGTSAVSLPNPLAAYATNKSDGVQINNPIQVTYFL